METNQFVEFVSAVVHQLPSKFTMGAAQRWRAATAYELYLSPTQRGGEAITGFDLEQNLHQENLVDRTSSLNDRMVKAWLVYPTTYPEEFKVKAILLLKSQKGSGTNRSVAYLIWSGDHVVKAWARLGSWWDGSDAVLLAN